MGTGSKRLVIDTGQGIPDWANLISSTFSTSKISLSHVFLAHWHGDHTFGVPDLIRMYPPLSSSIYKHTPSKTQQPITDGQVLRVEGTTIRAAHTLGHSHDHMCFVLEEEHAMFTGDAVLGHGTARGRASEDVNKHPTHDAVIQLRQGLPGPRYCHRRPVSQDYHGAGTEGAVRAAGPAEVGRDEVLQ